MKTRYACVWCVCVCVCICPNVNVLPSLRLISGSRFFFPLLFPEWWWLWLRRMSVDDVILAMCAVSRWAVGVWVCAFMCFAFGHKRNRIQWDLMELWTTWVLSSQTAANVGSGTDLRFVTHVAALPSWRFSRSPPLLCLSARPVIGLALYS